MSRKHLRCAVCAAVLWGFSAARAVPIYGGPEYDPSADTGYRSPRLPTAPGSTAGSGVGAGNVTKYIVGSQKGTRAVRWGASGVIELGNLGTDSAGRTSMSVSAVNSAGTAVGYANAYAGDTWMGERAVRWDASSAAAAALGTLSADGNGFTRSFAHAINAAGIAAGEASFYDAQGLLKGSRAVRWDAAGIVAELANLGTDTAGTTNSAAYAINNAGVAAGHASVYAGGTWQGPRAVRWDAAGTASELGTLGVSGTGFGWSEAYALNDDGVVVGESQRYDAGIYKGTRAVRWGASGAAMELGDLGADDGGTTFSIATAINSAGVAVGSADKYIAGEWLGVRAVRWDASGAALELGNLGTDAGGYTSNSASAINDAGLIVGTATKYDGAGNILGGRAVMWGLDGVAIELNTLIDPASGWLNLAEAVGISSDNWITGIGSFDPDGAGALAAYDRLFLLQVPEPGAIGLLAAAGMMLLGRRRR